MTTAADINQTFDLLGLVSSRVDLKHNGRWYIGPCPICGGRDRFNLKETPTGWRWFCRGDHSDSKYHGTIDLIMQLENVDFKRALEILGVNDFTPAPFRPAPIPQAKLAPPADWQDAAYQVMKWAEANLSSPQAEKARAWLAARGWDAAAIATWNIGYSHGAKIAGLWVDRGIVIPTYEAGEVWALNVRRPAGEPKYKKVTGSRSALFGADTAGMARTVFLTEGELDAGLLWKYICNQPNTLDVGVVTMGGNTQELDMATWGGRLLTASRLIACYDMDRAGEAGFNKLAMLTDRIRRATIPAGMGKDITDYWKAGGDLTAWVRFQLEANH